MKAQKLRSFAVLKSWPTNLVRPAWVLDAILRVRAAQELVRLPVLHLAAPATVVTTSAEPGGKARCYQTRRILAEHALRILSTLAAPRPDAAVRAGA